MTATATISRPLRKLLAAGPAIFRDGNTLITGDACPAELLPELEALCLPRISDEDGRAVVALLKEHAGRVRYVVEQEEAVDVVAELMEAEALAFDVETAPLSHYRAPVPLAFTKSGTLRKRQPTTGVAGLALDPYRSRVRLVSVFGGTSAGAVVFDIFKLGWDALAPLWTKPLIAANATFDVRRLMEEAQVDPGCRLRRASRRRAHPRPGRTVSVARQRHPRYSQHRPAERVGGFGLGSRALIPRPTPLLRPRQRRNLPDPPGAGARAIPPGPSAAPPHGRVRRSRLRDGARRHSARSRSAPGANRRMECQASAVSATRSAL